MSKKMGKLLSSFDQGDAADLLCFPNMGCVHQRHIEIFILIQREFSSLKSKIMYVIVIRHQFATLCTKTDILNVSWEEYHS